MTSPAPDPSPDAATHQVPPSADRANDHPTLSPDHAHTATQITFKLTVALNAVLAQAETKPLTLGLIIDSTHERAFGVLMAFLCIPFLQPIPLPGVSIPFGIALTLLGVQVAIGWHKPWLPQRMRGWKLPPRATAAFLRAVGKVFRPLEKIIHPRLSFMQNRGSFFIVGIAIAIDGLLLTLLPAFPGSNLIPAWIAILKILGLTEEDGILMLLGTFLTFATVVLAIVAGDTVVHWLQTWFNGAAATQPATLPTTLPQ